MEDFWIFMGALVVIGGAAWTGAKVAFFTTLFLKALFGKATRPEPQQPQQPQIVYVPVHNHHYGHMQHDNDFIDVTPRMNNRYGHWVE